MAPDPVADRRADPLLDPPSWAPRWLPSIDDDRQLRRFRWVLVAVFVAGLASCVSRGADAPPDPQLGDPAPSTTEAVVDVGDDVVDP